MFLSSLPPATPENEVDANTRAAWRYVPDAEAGAVLGDPSHPDLLEALGAFDRTERSSLLTWAMDRLRFKLGGDFRSQLRDQAGLLVPESCFVAMNYRFDWLHAALEATGSRGGPDTVCARDLAAPANTDAEIDLLVAYLDETGRYQIVLIEAKTHSSDSNMNVIPKANRLKALFGDEGCSYPNIDMHFVSSGPEESDQGKARNWLQSPNWPRWLHQWKSMHSVGFPKPGSNVKVTRCDKDGNDRGWAWTHWKVEGSHP